VRLEGNSLSAALVFGRRAGMHAARYCRAGKRAPAIDRAAIEEYRCALLTPFRCASGESPFLLLRELQECMSRFVGVARTAAGLENARTAIKDLRGRWRNVAVSGGLAYNPGWHLALELDSLLSVAEATVLASGERKESRGCHRRSDFPQADERYEATSLLISRSNDELVVDWRNTWLASRRRSRSGVAIIAAGSLKSTA
jgi:succinate dehydrogenase / fumarate reductase flavoprotein subunit